MGDLDPSYRRQLNIITAIAVAMLICLLVGFALTGPHI